MNVQEKITMIKCYAYQKRNCQDNGEKEGEILERWIDEEALAGEVTVEEIDQACRLSEYEIMYFGDESFTILPKEQEELLQWLQKLIQSSLLGEETKNQILEAYQLLSAQWGK